MQNLNENVVKVLHGIIKQSFFKDSKDPVYLYRSVHEGSQQLSVNLHQLDVY